MAFSDIQIPLNIFPQNHLACLTENDLQKYLMKSKNMSTSSLS